MEKILQNSTLLNKNIGFVEYTTKIVFSILMALGLCYVLSTKRDVLNSYIMCTLAFALATYIMSYLFFSSTWVTKVIITAFFIKILLGLIHYLVFFDFGYFSSSGHFLMFSNEEYATVYKAISIIADNKSFYGLWYTDLSSVSATHPEMMHLLSFPFVFFGNNILTISPFNAFCSSVICVSFVCIAQSYLKLSESKIKYYVYLIAYFPFFLISSYFARDIAGMTVMSIGIAMYLLSGQTLYKYLSLACALYLFYIHRTIYPVLLIIAVFFGPLIGMSKKNILGKSIFAISLALIVSLLAESLWPFVFTEVEFNTYESTRQMESANIIIKIAMFFIGPLWRQVYTAPEYSYVIQETFVVVLLDSSLITLFQCRNSLKLPKVNTLTLLGVLLIVVGGFSANAHVPYLAVGVLFFIPYIVDVSQMEVLIKNIKVVSIILVSINILSLFLSFGVL